MMYSRVNRCIRPNLLLICFYIWPFVFYGGKTSCDFKEDNASNSPCKNVSRIEIDSTSPKKVAINLVMAPIKSIPTDASNFALPRKVLHLTPEYPVARKILENYYGSSDKTPGGHCLVVSKNRFIKAYEDVYGNSFYKDLPSTIATKQLTPNQVFDNLYITATKQDPEWRNLPRKYRAKGNAGALAIAGLGEIVDTEAIWTGRLRPGALVQVWRLKEDYEKVRKGVKILDFDPYGHSFIFLEYERNGKGEIEGMKIADQGYQSYRSLVPRDYEIWWGVNLRV